MNTYLSHMDLKNHIILILIWFFYVLTTAFIIPHLFITLIYLAISIYWILFTLPKERLKGKHLWIYSLTWLSMLLLYLAIFVNLFFIALMPLIVLSVYIAIDLYKHPRVYKTNLAMHKVQYKQFIVLLWLMMLILFFKTSLMWMLIPVIVIMIKDQMVLMKEMKVFEKRMPLTFITVVMFAFLYLSTTVETDGGRSYHILFSIDFLMLFLLSLTHLIWSKKTYEKHVLETKEKKIKV